MLGLIFFYSILQHYIFRSESSLYKTFFITYNFNTVLLKRKLDFINLKLVTKPLTYTIYTI